MEILTYIGLVYKKHYVCDDVKRHEDGYLDGATVTKAPSGDRVTFPH